MKFKNSDEQGSFEELAAAAIGKFYLKDPDVSTVDRVLTRLVTNIRRMRDGGLACLTCEDYEQYGDEYPCRDCIKYNKWRPVKGA